MRLLIPALLLPLASCVSAPLMLAEDPLERAATCSAVRLLELGAGKAGDEPLSFAGWTEVVHFAALYAAEDAVLFQVERIGQVTERAEALRSELEGQNWESLVEPCNAAVPETQKDASPLPADAFEAGMTCHALGDFLARTGATDHPEESRKLAAIANKALAAAQPVLIDRARGDASEAERIASGYAARAFRAGRPTSLIAQCRRRFPT